MRKVDQGYIKYLINEKEMTANVSETNTSKNDIFIPRSIFHDSKEYFVTTILTNAFKYSQVLSIQFPPNSKIRTIEKDSFNASSIKNLTIPSSLTELKDGWCSNTSNLNKIEISPNNPRYQLYDNKFIIGKKLTENENFDVLVFCIRNIKSVKIPKFIEIIGPFDFEEI